MTDSDVSDWRVVVGAVLKARRVYYAELEKKGIDGCYFPLLIEACGVWEGEDFRPRKERVVFDDRYDGTKKEGA